MKKVAILGVAISLLSSASVADTWEPGFDVAYGLSDDNISSGAISYTGNTAGAIMRVGASYFEGFDTDPELPVCQYDAAFLSSKIEFSGAFDVGGASLYPHAGLLYMDRLIDKYWMIPLGVTVSAPVANFLNLYADGTYTKPVYGSQEGTDTGGERSGQGFSVEAGIEFQINQPFLDRVRVGGFAEEYRYGFYDTEQAGVRISAGI